MINPKTLELKYAKLTIRKLERANDGELYLHLSGFIFHSSMAVESVRVVRNGVTQHVLISLVPVRKGKDGNFDVRVPLTHETDTVVFGEPPEQVWPEG
ncbi:MAG: hypothetical protein ABI193_13390 [Minicystis sp.]